MNFINALAKHKIVEVNKLFGFLNGHIVAQAPYRQVTSETFLDNGAILFLDFTGELVLADNANASLKQPFLHYTEELLNGPVSGLEYFTVDIDETLGNDLVCYPRAIALYEGDEFTTSNFTTAILGGLLINTKYIGALNASGVIEVYGTIPALYEGPVWLAEKDTMPAGQAAVHLTLIDKHYVGTGS